MKHWLRDTHFRSLLRNSSYLGLSKVVSAVAGVSTIAFAGRSLGVAGFGILVLISSYAQAASGISKFQSWQIVVRFGGGVLAGGDPRHFKDATGFAFALDALSGIGGMIAAMALVPLLGPWFGIPAQELHAAALYCLLLPTMAAATPNGVTRALDRFDLTSWQQTVSPVSRTILAAVGWWLGWGLHGFLAVWFISDLSGDLFMWFLAWRETRRRGLLHGIRPTLRPALPGAWKFALHVNLTSSLQSASGPLARLLVGGILGPVAAGLYRVAATLADSAQKPADLLGRAFYPEIMRMDIASRQPWKLMLRTVAAAGLFAAIAVLVVLVGGRPLLGNAFGHGFADAYPILLIMLGVPILSIISFPLPPMLYALDRADVPLKARIVSFAAYLAAVFPLGWRFGVQGAAFAYLFSTLVMVLVLAVALRSQHRRVRGR